MKNIKGLSIIELLVSLVVSSIIILMVGVLSSIANRSFNKLNKEQSIYSDISHGFRLLQYKVRNAASLTAGTTLSPWVTNEYFLIDSAIFGICHYNFSTNSCD